MNSLIVNSIHTFTVSILLNGFSHVSDTKMDSTINVPQHNREDEVKKAGLRLLRLQVTYRLDTFQLSEGILSGPKMNLQSIQYQSYPMNGINTKKFLHIHFCTLVEYQFDQLTADECMDMARYSYLIGEDNYADAWLNQTSRKYETEDQKTVSVKDILKYKAFTSYKLGKRHHLNHN